MPRPQHSVRVYTYPADPAQLAAGRLELVRIYHYDTCKYFARHDRGCFVRVPDDGPFVRLPGRLPRTVAIQRGYGLLRYERIDGISEEAIACRIMDDTHSYAYRAAAEGIRLALRDIQPVYVSCQRRSGRG